AGLERLASAGLIQRDEAGNVYIDGWEKWTSTASSTERSRRHRERMRGKAGGKGTSEECNALQRECNAATLHASPSVASVPCNGGDEIPLLSSPLLSSDRVPQGTPASPEARSPHEVHHHRPGLPVRGSEGLARTQLGTTAAARDLIEAMP